jgi:AcrR family transcriptional regulator
MESRTTQRKSRSDGERSRQAILSASAKLATIEGLRGLTIGGLAEATGMSKSGLYAHFGSKEELQLATIDAADEIFEREVVGPATASGDYVAQILQLSDRFLDYVGSDVFPGGCFFAAASAELDTHPGRVKERIAAFQAGWMGRFIQLISQAQAEGEIDAKEDPMQLGFELNSMLTLANSIYVMFGDRSAFARARRGIRQRLGIRAGRI